jgi:hypothetical protein
MSARAGQIRSQAFLKFLSRILVGEMIALDQWELLPIWELILPDEYS